MSGEETPTDSGPLALEAEALGITLSPPQLAKLTQYCQLVWAWNEKLNLTRHTDWPTFVRRDLLDSVRLADCLAAGERVLDVGSGSGVPGIPLAILRPDLRVVLSESVTKKAKVLTEIVRDLGLPLRVQAERGEEVVARERFDAVVFRGVGAMPRLLRWFAPLWHNMGRMLMIKGPRWVEERGEARHYGLLRGLQLRRLAHYPMPGTDSESVILAVCRPTESENTEQDDG